LKKSSGMFCGVLFTKQAELTRSAAAHNGRDRTLSE
jgi:hypothetical protein